MSVHFGIARTEADTFSKDGSIATAVFQTSCRIGYAIGLAVATLIQVNVETHALNRGASETDALAKGLSAAFWFCGACAASGKRVLTLQLSPGNTIGALVILFGMRGWQMLSEMKQGGEEAQEAVDSSVELRTNSEPERWRG